MRLHKTIVLASLAVLLAATGAAATTFQPPAADGQDQVALCVYGDAYNTGGSPCAGAVCVGWTMGRWVDCYPRLPPCWACPPPARLE